MFNQLLGLAILADAENKRNKANQIMLRRWIPVSERLPEKTDNYLVCSKKQIWVANWFNNTWWGIEKRCRYTDIEAWMPLPAPYIELCSE